LAGVATPPTAYAQSTDPATRFVEVSGGYRLLPDITYLRAGGIDLKLDLYQARGSTPTPTLIYIHGGGWTNGSKESSALTFLPYLEMGWSVVNVEYRMADVAHAPAALEDCRCALRWIYRNAERYNFDVSRIVVTGNSAGAIINWYGITDVVGLMQGPPGSSGNFTEAWLGSRSDRADVAARVSPLTYVRPGLPPVLTIHGEADPIVPHDHALRLHQALDTAGVPNQLVTVPGGGHGGFGPDENVRIYESIRAFLQQHSIL
jgi:acetyl esterase/lipase